MRMGCRSPSSLPSIAVIIYSDLVVGKSERRDNEKEFKCLSCMYVLDFKCYIYMLVDRAHILCFG